MRTTPWRRRRVTDSPRPAGRGLGRLRRSSSLARRLVAIRPIHPIRTLRRRRDRTSVIESIDQPVIPISPAPAGASTYVDDPDAPPAPIPLLPGEPTARRRFYFCLANSCTVTSILLGMGAIMLALNGSVQIAAVLLLGCILMDALDGPLARRFGVASPFGAQMDSMADMCSFGIAAPLVVFQTMGADLPTWALGAACALVAVCAAIRLARFNVSPKDGRFFSGVPTTYTRSRVGLGHTVADEPSCRDDRRYRHVGAHDGLEFPVREAEPVAQGAAVAVAVAGRGLLLSIEVTFIVLVAVYLLSGPVLWAVHRRQAIVA